MWKCEKLYFDLESIKQLSFKFNICFEQKKLEKYPLKNVNCFLWKTLIGYNYTGHFLPT
jgi:hypothetical protein